MLNREYSNLISTKSKSIEKNTNEFDILNEIDNLSLKQKLSKKYKEELNGKIINLQNTNNDFLFYKREKNLVEIIEEMKEIKEKTEDTGNLINGFLLELQKLLGVKNPENIIENFYNDDNESLIKKLQKLYKIVHKKTNR